MMTRISEYTASSKTLVKQHQWLLVKDPVNEHNAVRACNDCGVIHTDLRARQVCRGDVEANIVAGSLSFAA